ncbi:MAG: protein-glutamate O-methyltransferase family protein [Cyanobacteria bacterium]|nr:protein-glutamate O-methyltransferase family protein [Cyanobacteria bacterium CG_2015-16_32_12]NCO79489.1 protein-glutamate O-methyltransferase family protein [Cyanobacteria bacterium CG_2015-22_32_23]
MDLNQSPPAIAQLIHRRLRELVGVTDPYRETKDWQNRIAMELIPKFRAEVKSAKNPLLMAARLAIAGNVIDMGSNGNLTESDVRQSLSQALTEPFFGEEDKFQQAITQAKSVLYLADNAGEIAFDQLLIEEIIEQISAKRVTLVVRGAPILIYLEGFIVFFLSL